MRILFSLLTPAFLKNFEAPVREFAARGHEVILVSHERTAWAGAEELATRLSAELPTVSLEEAPPLDGRNARLAIKARACADYLRFLDPRFTDTYRARAEKRVPRQFRAVASLPGMRTAFGRVLLAGCVRAATRLLPADRDAIRFLRARRPDVVLISPYVGLSTDQPDYLRAAQAIGLPTAVCVGSWDHLSSKSVIRPAPDLLTVWNETQRREATELHGVPDSKVSVTGAPCFDHWFERQPEPREAFCRRAGLDPSEPFLLYTCFSPFKGAPDEADFVLRWLKQIRASANPGLARAGVLVRPHPKRLAQWEGLDVDSANVAVWPREGGRVGDESSSANFFNSIYHSAAVVGINTSAMIEAGIVGRPVHTLLMPEYWDSQQGTLHFRYLMEVGGGLLVAARSFGEHMNQLAATVDAVDAGSGGCRAFLEAFVRPHGLDNPATPRFVEAIERLSLSSR